MKNNRRLNNIISENLDKVVRQKMVNEQRFAAIFRNNLMNESKKLQKFVAKKSRSLQEGKGQPLNMEAQFAHMFAQAARKTLTECNARHIVLSEDDIRRVCREVIKEGFWDNFVRGAKEAGRTYINNGIQNPLGNLFGPGQIYNLGKSLAKGWEAFNNSDSETPAQKPANSPAAQGGGGSEAPTAPVAKKRSAPKKQAPAKPQTAPSQPVETTPAGKPSAEYQAAKAQWQKEMPNMHLKTPELTAQDWQDMARNSQKEIAQKEREEALAQQDAYNDALTQYNTQKADRQLIGSRAGRQFRKDWAEDEAARLGHAGDKKMIRQLSRQMKKDAKLQRRGEFNDFDY